MPSFDSIDRTPWTRKPKHQIKNPNVTPKSLNLQNLSPTKKVHLFGSLRYHPQDILEVRLSVLKPSDPANMEDMLMEARYRNPQLQESGGAG